MDSAEELARLYVEYIAALAQKEYVRLVRAPQPNDAVTAQLLSQLPTLSDAPSAVGEAMAWWKRQGSSPGFARMERLHHLLRRLNRVLASVTQFRVETEQGILSLGSPWWATYWREKHGAMGGLPGEMRFSVDGRPLTNIRLLPEQPRWASSPGFASHVTRTLRRGCNGRRELRIGLCVLGRFAKTKFAKTEWLDTASGLHGFRGTEVAQPDEQGVSAADELRECIHWARDNQVHVLCFPELAIDAVGREVLREEIVTDPGSLCVIIPGSFHEPSGDGGAWVNRAPVWLVESGLGTGAGPVEQGITLRDVGAFDKTDPFSFPAKAADEVLGEAPPGCINYQEDINGGTALTVVDSPAGRIGLAICKDAMRGSLIDRYGQVVDHLIVVSMNDRSTGWFWINGETLARRDAVAAFYVNSTQFLAEDDDAVDLAFWCFPELTKLENVVFRRRLPPGPVAPSASEWVRLTDRRANVGSIPKEYRVYVPIRLPGTVLDS